MLSRPSYRFLWLLTSLLFTLIVAGCAKSVGVSVHGVNYRIEDFGYWLVDPERPEQFTAGEELAPFSAGGTTCCYPLPRKWRPGIQIRIKTTHSLPKDASGEYREAKEEYLAEVPPYVNGEPGELWVLRGPDGKITVVSSDFQPDHPKWPGKIRGWPVPSIEYRRARWELYRQHEQGGVDLYVSLLNELEKEPDKRTNEAWAFAKEHDAQEIKGFTGPSDPHYKTFLKKDYEAGLGQSKKLLQEVMEAKP